jgi:hypothetical protein
MRNRRFALYFSWSRSKETEASLGTLENRFPTLFEFRRAIWPAYEQARDPATYDQGIAGFLDHVILFDFRNFGDVMLSATGHRPVVIQREVGAGANGQRRELDDALLSGIDTLIVVSLDHFQTAQEATSAEVEAIRRFTEREDACLIVCPHHDVGATDSESQRKAEFTHHGDRLVPAQQRIGGFARTLLAQLGLPIENRYGLHPAAAADGSPASLEVFPDLDDLGALQGVSTFNLHSHLPHLYIPPAVDGQVRLLARQPIAVEASPHPFVDAGNRQFNALIWAPPQGKRGASIFVCDATLWSSAFGGAGNLVRFWKNLAHV